MKSFESLVRIAGSIATVLAFFVLAWNGYQQRKALKIQENELDLHRREIGNIDSTVAVMRGQMETMGEANALQRDYNQMLRQRLVFDDYSFIETNRPRIGIDKASILAEGDSLLLCIDLKHAGGQTANHIEMEIEIKNHQLKSLRWPPFTITQMSQSEIRPFKTRLFKQAPYLVRIRLSWFWEFNRQTYSTTFYRDIFQDSLAKVWKTFQIGEREGDSIWSIPDSKR